MLQIKDIRKQYITGDLVQTALDGVSLTLRDNEFVAILGPSGSGKTTLLNVIGGLDKYDSGDLIINGVSTRKYTHRDWDSYRNHTIGFVFQSYNLIPHQTVLSNVELALTISGISRAERKRRAIQALENVGLGNQLHKRPNQMSGGQMQRVAIARALVNNPDILLADEPTGALDSDTSVQIMELLKEVAHDRLVVMVTHNPELAYEYANRIVRVRDGRIVDDSNPYEADIASGEGVHRNMGRSSMSFLTALSLSFNNLKTKKGRTLLTAFAGSIGIIGIALIMSLSTGFQNYIDRIQEDTLSNYPLTIMKETSDMSSMLSAMGSAGAKADESGEGTVVEQPMITQMFAQVGSNDLASFKIYLEENSDAISHTINDITYDYGVSPLIYAQDTSNGILQANPGTLMGELMGSSVMSSYMDTDVFQEMVENIAMLESQYDVLEGRWPESYDELLIVLSDPNQITDYVAYTLGLKDPQELTDLMSAVLRGETVDPDALSGSAQWDYSELMSLRFRLVNAADRYRYNAEYNVWEDLSDDTSCMTALIENGVELKIVGIVCPRDGVSTTALSPGVAYTHALTEYVIGEARDSDIVKAQLASPDTDVFTGQPFGEESESAGLNFESMISVDENALSNAFGMDIDMNSILGLLSSYMGDLEGILSNAVAPAQTDFTQAVTELATDMLHGWTAEGATKIHMADIASLVESYLSGDSATAILSPLASRYGIGQEEMTASCSSLLTAMVTGYVSENLTADVPEPSPTESSEEAESAETGESSDTGEDVLPESILSAFYAVLAPEDVDGIVSGFMGSTAANAATGAMAVSMSRSTILSAVTGKLSGFSGVLSNYMSSAFYVDTDAIANAFQFNMSEEELQRLISTLYGSSTISSRDSNLKALGYADMEKPEAIYIYLKDFEGKEEFLGFLDDYNEKMEASGDTDRVIRYTDITGILMSSVSTIINSVSYVLIAFVAVSLVVSSIMIGIITYISVMERTREIGVLRAIGASKRNISQVFNAETFIIGLCSGLLGVGITILLNIPINIIIRNLTGTSDIHSQLPVVSGVILVILSVILTLIGGLIPSRQAAKKDPVIALRSE